LFLWNLRSGGRGFTTFLKKLLMICPKKDMYSYLIEIKALQLQFVRSFLKAVLHTVVNILQTMFKQTLEQSVGLSFGDVLRQEIRRVLKMPLRNFEKLIAKQLNMWMQFLIKLGQHMLFHIQDIST
jgi:hypothetical protein